MLSEPRGKGARDQSVRPGAPPYRHVEDRGAEAGARPPRFRRRLRRRAPRRGTEPRQGTHFLLPHVYARLGSEETAPRTVVPRQRPQGEGRERTRLPDLELDRARHLDLHAARQYPPRAPLFTRA